MRSRRPTPQLLDPLGGLTARTFTFLTAGIAVLIAGMMLLFGYREITSAGLQVAALSLLAASIAVLLDGVSPSRFPFGTGRHASLHVLGLGAVVLDAAGREPGAQSGAWGAICLAVLMVMIGSFRPSSEIIGFAIGSSLAVGVVAAIYSGPLGGWQATEIVIARSAPILAVGLASAAFSRTLVSRLSEWRGANAQAYERERETVRAMLLPQVNERREYRVEPQVAPFLRQILDAGILTPTDAARARGFATAMRRGMLRDASETWLTDLASGLTGEPQLADEMNAEQRTALGALLTELRGSTEGNAAQVHGSITRAGESVSAHLWTDVTSTVHSLRTDAYRAVLRTVFDRARVQVSGRRLEIHVDFTP